MKKSIDALPATPFQVGVLGKKEPVARGGIMGEYTTTIHHTWQGGKSDEKATKDPK